MIVQFYLVNNLYLKNNACLELHNRTFTSLLKTVFKTSMSTEGFKTPVRRRESEPCVTRRFSEYGVNSADSRNVNGSAKPGYRRSLSFEPNDFWRDEVKSKLVMQKRVATSNWLFVRYILLSFSYSVTFLENTFLMV